MYPSTQFIEAKQRDFKTLKNSLNFSWTVSQTDSSTLVRQKRKKVTKNEHLISTRQKTVIENSDDKKKKVNIQIYT